MMRSYIQKRKYMLAFLACIALFVSILLGCKKDEYDNPYDSNVSASSWAPDYLEISQTSLKTVQLKWNQQDLRIDSFCIEVKRGQAEWKVIGYSGKTNPKFIDTAFIPDPGLIQSYRVHALAWKNNSTSIIKAFKATFPKPFAPYVTRVLGIKIKVYWMDNYTNEDNYKVEKKVEGGNWVLCADTIRANSTYFYDTAPELNTQILYRLSARARGIYSDTIHSNKISTVILPPTWFTVFSLSRTSCRVEWKQGDIWTTGYNVDRQFGNSPWQDGWMKLDSAKTTFTDSNLPPDQDIKYRVSTIVSNIISSNVELTYGLAVMDTISVSKISYSSVSVKTIVKSEPGTPVTEWGFVYGTTPNPTIADTKAIAPTAGNISFTAALAGLDNSKTYYIRPYAINRRSETYGEQKTIVLLSYRIPQLDIVKFYSLSYINTNMSSNILIDGGLPILEAGFVYSTTPIPTVNDKIVTTSYKASATGIYPLDSYLPNLTNGVMYYVRSFARNSLGVGYGPENTLNLLAYTLPVIDTLIINSVEATRVQLTCWSIKDGGGWTKRGFVYGITVNPTINDNIWTDPYHGTINFTTYFTGLTPNQTYHARAYSQNLAGYIYSPDKAFTTLGVSVPKMDTTITGNIYYITAAAVSQMNSDGGMAAIEAGFVLSTSPDPTINDKKYLCALVAPDYIIRYNFNPLVEGTTYYIRSFARNSLGTSYGKGAKFTMKPYTLPVIGIVQAYNITKTNAQLASYVSSNGGDQLSEAGFVYGDKPGLTIADTKLLAYGGNCVLNNLLSGHTYYARSYVKNTKGIVYSPEITFQTLF